MSDTPGSSKAIGSLVKKQSDVTRQGAQKLKFVPTLPQRRKKGEIKGEPTTPAIPPPSTSTDRGRGRGRGRGDARGRGRGRGAPPVIEMTASGPFAMGPALVGNNSRRSTPRSSFTPTVAPGASVSIGASLSQTAPPSLKKDSTDSAKGKGKSVKVDDDEEVYSDPDEGVEIVDMENVRYMDFMAPESLRKEQRLKKVKKEEQSQELGTGDVNLANAIDLSDSEQEEELEDIIEDFAAQISSDADSALREERLYFFRFPSPFPTYLPGLVDPSPISVDVEMPDAAAAKSVTFAIDVKPPSPTPSSSRLTPSVVASDPAKPEALDGVIGQLEVYRSGAVKIRLDNGILLDVNSATQPSFLQQAVFLNMNEKRLNVLGEVNKQFVVSPNVDALLSAMELADAAPSTIESEEGLIKMDVT